MKSQRIGILGSGAVAKSLASGFLAQNCEVKLGTGHPDKLADWLQKMGANASVGSFQEAAKFGNLIVLAVSGKAAHTVLSSVGEEALNGKTIVDVTNPIADKPPVNGVLHFFTDINYSLMEQLQAKYPAANFVKAFNSVGNGLMVNPGFNTKPTMFICGNSESAKEAVSEILAAFGWEKADMGAAEAARAIEPLCMLWCIPGFKDNQWTHAFKLMR